MPCEFNGGRGNLLTASWSGVNAGLKILSWHRHQLYGGSNKTKRELPVLAESVRKNIMIRHYGLKGLDPPPTYESAQTRNSTPAQTKALS